MPLWQVAPPGKGGTYPRSAVVPEIPTFEEFFAMIHPGRKPSGIEYETMRTAIDAQTALFRTVFMPPKSPKEAADVLKNAITDLWKNPSFIRDYAKVVKSDPVLVSGEDGAAIMAALGKVRPEIKSFLVEYGNRLTRR